MNSIQNWIRLESFQNSRTMFLLQEGELISHDSGREENVYSIVRPLIMERPIFGWGIGSDRYFLDGAYSHYIFWKFICTMVLL